MFLGVSVALLGIGALGTASWAVWRRKARAETVVRLHALGRLLSLQNIECKRFPSLSLLGRYHTYPLVVECVRKGDQIIWRLHSECAVSWEGRLHLQGEARHGKMRELYGLEVVVTGDVAFDSHILLAATDESRAHALFTPYLRSRWAALPLQHFSIDIDGQIIYAEYTTVPKEPVGSLIPVVTLLFETCDRLR